MANLKFYTKKGKNNLSKVYVRFYCSRTQDFSASTNLYVNNTEWDSKKGKLKNTADQDQYFKKKKELEELEEHILQSFKDDLSEKEVIDRFWFRKTINRYFHRAEHGEKDLTMLTEYFQHYIEILESTPKRNGEMVTKATVTKFNTILSKIKTFEKQQKRVFKLKHVDREFHKSILQYFYSIKLSKGTAGKYLEQIRTVIYHAERNDYTISKDVRNPENFAIPKERTVFTTLTIPEIEKIEKTKMEKPHLENVRKWLIIGVWTAARGNEFLKFSKDNLTGDKSEIHYIAQKGGKKLEVPIHRSVSKILSENNWKFPRKICLNTFNKHVKEVARLCGLTYQTKGKLDPNGKGEKILGMFPKYKLIGSHVCRRSFATNHYGILPEEAIRNITGHSSNAMLLKYIGKESSHMQKNLLKDLWDKNEF